MKNLSNVLRNVLPFVIMLAVISPFIMFNNLFFPFITGKAIYFRTVAEVAVLIYIVLAALNKDVRPKMTPLMWGVSVFAVILSLATVFAADPLKAFWSNYERMEGLVLFLHLFAFFVVAGSTMKKKDGWWTWFFNASLIMSIIVGVEAFLTFYSDPNHTGYRIFGHLGNSSYLGVYSLIHIFICLFFIVKKIGHRSAKVLSEQGSFVAIGFYALVAIFNLVVLFNTGTRGSFVGLVGGVFISAILIAIFEKQNRALRKTGLALVILSVAVVLFFGLFKEASFIKKSDMLNRFAELVTFDVHGVLENQGSARKMLWGTAWEGVKERPILGWGLDNFHYVFAEKYNPAMYGQEQWFDRSHNVFTDWMVSAGILGLLSYLSLFAFAIYMLWKISPQGMSFGLKAVIIGGFAAYFGHNIFVFDNLSSYILFFSVLAFIHDAYLSDREAIALAANPAHANKHNEKHSRHTYGTQATMALAASVIGIVVMGYVFYQVNMRPLVANAVLLDGLRPDMLDAKGKVVAQTPEQQYNKVKQSYEMNVMTNTEQLEQLAQKVAGYLGTNATPQAKAEAFTYVTEAFQKEFARAPKDPRPRYFYMVLLNQLGMYDQAYREVNSLVELSPNKQSFLTMKVIIEMQLKKNQEAYETALRSYNLEPRNEEAKRFYVASLILVGKTDEAEAFATTTEARIKYLEDGAILNAYMNSNQIPRAIALMKKELTTSENNIDLRSALINLYIKANDKANAIKELNALKNVEPSLKTQIDAMIKQLQGGK